MRARRLCAATSLPSTCSHVLGCVAQVVCWRRLKAKLRWPHRRARVELVEKQQVYCTRLSTRRCTACVPAQPSPVHMLSWRAVCCAQVLASDSACGASSRRRLRACRLISRVSHPCRLSFLSCAFCRVQLCSGQIARTEALGMAGQCAGVLYAQLMLSSGALCSLLACSEATHMYLYMYCRFLVCRACASDVPE